MKRCDFDEVLKFIKSTFGKDKVPLHEPKFIGNEKKYLLECIDSSFVSSVGKFVDEFESKLAQMVGAKFAVATTNGTSALHICLKLAGVEQNDEVITQPVTFIATCRFSWMSILTHSVCRQRHLARFWRKTAS